MKDFASLCEYHQIPHTPHRAASDAAVVMTLAPIVTSESSCLNGPTSRPR